MLLVHAKEILEKNLNKNFNNWANVIGTSGTCRAVADIILLNNLDTTTNSPIDEIGGFITLKGLKAIKTELIQAGNVNQSNLSGIKSERKAVIGKRVIDFISYF